MIVLNDLMSQLSPALAASRRSGSGSESTQIAKARYRDLTDYIDGFYNPRRRHSHLVASAPTSWKPSIGDAEEPSTKVWELHPPKSGSQMMGVPDRSPRQRDS